MDVCAGTTPPLIPLCDAGDEGEEGAERLVACHLYD